MQSLAVLLPITRVCVFDPCMQNMLTTPYFSRYAVVLGTHTSVTGKHVDGIRWILGAAGDAIHQSIGHTYHGLSAINEFSTNVLGEYYYGAL